MINFEKLKEMIFSSDNKACFIERERILQRLEKEMQEYKGTDKYARMLSTLLSEVSTPVSDYDIFAGRVVEALPDAGMKAPSLTLFSSGHMSFDYKKVLEKGLGGILEEIKTNARNNGDENSRIFAENSEIIITAVQNYCKRYAKDAQKKGFCEMAKALNKVPFEPAYDFYSALQGIWIIHMIAGCYVGSRDYAFGRFDSYMLPFYEKALEDGKTREEITHILAAFMLKTNEICGTCTHNYNQKPVLCQSSKQYINIGGEIPNEFSSVVLDAAMLLNMAQPQIVVLLDPEADEEFTKNTFEALSFLTDKMNVYNYKSVKNTLLKMGYDEAIAKDFTYSACCTFDLNYHSYRLENYVKVPIIFREVLESRIFESADEFVTAFKEGMRKEIQYFADVTMKYPSDDDCRKWFVFDSLFMTDSTVECRYACDRKAKYYVMNIFCPGIATVGDSLMVIDKLVFKEKRYTYSEFMEIIKNNFEGNEELRQEILNYTKFGNDTDADEYTALAGRAFIDTTKEIKLKSNFRIAPGFYSLERDNSWSAELEATPDGRKAGEPFSENQSPTYGADKKGITALLKSISKLPLKETVTGGLNLTFSQKVSPDILRALVTSYFEMGGLHVGVGIIDTETLEDAMKNPDNHKTLTVRLYGFSEYFVSLPKWQQIALLNRTQY